MCSTPRHVDTDGPVQSPPSIAGAVYVAIVADLRWVGLSCSTMMSPGAQHHGHHQHPSAPNGPPLPAAPLLPSLHPSIHPSYLCHVNANPLRHKAAASASLSSALRARAPCPAPGWLGWNSPLYKTCGVVGFLLLLRFRWRKFPSLGSLIVGWWSLRRMVSASGDPILGVVSATVGSRG